MSNLPKIDRNRFRHPSTNQRFVKGLFFETSRDKDTVVYTLKDHDHNGFPSLYLIYMSVNDPTEWRVATEFTDGWEHWQMLCDASWFKPYVERWRKELELRMKSQALVRIMSEAKTTSRESFMANKYLLEKGWEPKESAGSKRGRPSKDEIKQAAQEAASTNDRIIEDFERIRSLRN